MLINSSYQPLAHQLLLLFASITSAVCTSIKDRTSTSIDQQPWLDQSARSNSTSSIQLRPKILQFKALMIEVYWQQGQVKLIEMQYKGVFSTTSIIPLILTQFITFITTHPIINVICLFIIQIRRLYLKALAKEWYFDNLLYRYCTTLITFTPMRHKYRDYPSGLMMNKSLIPIKSPASE